eukprot:scaffold4579_cov79-Isochrysis_galbana.AAC.1
MLCACDTFRAGAVEQLRVHAQVRAFLPHGIICPPRTVFVAPHGIWARWSSSGCMPWCDTVSCAPRRYCMPSASLLPPYGILSRWSS